jgi:hypothetical protein
MSDSDTFLDNILEGVIATDAPVSTPEQSTSSDQATTGRTGSASASPTSAQESPETPDAPPPPLTGLDALLEGMPAMSDLNAPTTSVEASQPRPTGELRPEPVPNRSADTGRNGQVFGSVTEATRPDAPDRPDAEVGAPSAGLPVAAPHDILGLPGQPDVSASHIELALEINDVASAQPHVEARLPAVSSFASIAQEIADTVETKPSAHRPTATGADAKDADRSSVYLRTRGRRRRRVNRTTRVAVTQVIAIMLLLVVGLAAEYEYVARGHTNSATTSAPLVPTLPVTRLPVVAPTPAKGFLFHFAKSGSAQSTAFRVVAPFSVAVSARCSPATKSSSVDVVLQSGGRQAANIFVAAAGTGTHERLSATVAPGTYILIAHTSGTCSWSAEGVPRS